MPDIVQSAVIPVEPAVVWGVVSEPGLAPKWMPDLDRRELLSPAPLEAGGRWRDHGRLRKKTFQAEYEVTLWEPPRCFAYAQVSGRDVGYVWNEHVELEAQDGGTRVTLHLEYVMPGGLMARLYERLLFRKDYRITLENRLNALREYFEKA